jgi:hypothetical protein
MVVSYAADRPGLDASDLEYPDVMAYKDRPAPGRRTESAGKATELVSGKANGPAGKATESVGKANEPAGKATESVGKDIRNLETLEPIKPVPGLAPQNWNVTRYPDGTKITEWQGEPKVLLFEAPTHLQDGKIRNYVYRDGITIKTTDRSIQVLQSETQPAQRIDVVQELPTMRNDDQIWKGLWTRFEDARTMMSTRKPESAPSAKARNLSDEEVKGLIQLEDLSPPEMVLMLTRFGDRIRQMYGTTRIPTLLGRNVATQIEGHPEMSQMPRLLELEKVVDAFKTKFPTSNIPDGTAEWEAAKAEAWRTLFEEGF